jgi:hypothetical protein
MQTSIVKAKHSCNELCVITRGIATKVVTDVIGPSTPFTKGAYFGLEVVLRNGKHAATMRSLTFVVCLKLNKADLGALLRDNERVYPQTTKLIRRFAAKMQFERYVKQIGAFTRVLQKRGRLAKEEYKEYKGMLLAQATQKSLQANKVSSAFKDSKADTCQAELKEQRKQLVEDWNPALVEYAEQRIEQDAKRRAVGSSPKSSHLFAAAPERKALVAAVTEVEEFTTAQMAGK